MHIPRTAASALGRPAAFKRSAKHEATTRTRQARKPTLPRTPQAGLTIAAGRVRQEMNKLRKYAASCRRERMLRATGAGHPRFCRMHASLPGVAGPDDLDR
jgi:hypothetical protein